MSYNFSIALDGLLNMRIKWEEGCVIELPNGAKRIVVGPALHSETLQCMLVVFDPQKQSFSSIVLSAAEKTDDQNEPPEIFNHLYEPKCWHHKKGRIYTSILEAASKEGAMTLYVSHADNTWWIRPSAMFNDGRFTPNQDTNPLSISNLTGMDKAA